MRTPETNQYDAVAIALSALVWALSDEARAARLLAVTGLTAGDLRARAAEPALLAAVIGFLEAHEPDLLACADAIGAPPATIVAAGRELSA